jgi:hypothetical protein
MTAQVMLLIGRVGLSRRAASQRCASIGRLAHAIESRVTKWRFQAFIEVAWLFCDAGFGA